MKTILLDVDEVLVDCNKHVHKRAERYFKKTLPDPNTSDTCEFADSMGLTQQDWRDFEWELQRENVLGYLINWNDGAEDFVKGLSEFANIVFVTAHWQGLSCWVPARDALIKNTFEGAKIVYTHHKELVQGDFLLDDRPKNLIANKNRAIVWDRTWNRHLYEMPRVTGYNRALNYLRVLCT